MPRLQYTPNPATGNAPLKSVSDNNNIGYSNFLRQQCPTNTIKKGFTMAQAQKGDRVIIDYTGTLEDGTIFDSTLEGDCCDDGQCSTDSCEDEGCGCDESGPMELTIGGDEFFPQIEEALIGMAPGEKKTVVVPAAEAFGEYDEERVFTVARSELPEDMPVEVGAELVLTGEDDEDELAVTVVEATPEQVTFDANHPLAGEDLTFEITLNEIVGK